MLAEVAWFLGVVVLVFLPGLCFVALFRLIDFMAHDAIVGRARRGEIGSRATGQSEAVAASDGAPSVDRSADDRSTCRACGVENWAGATYCRNCLSEG